MTELRWGVLGTGGIAAGFLSDLAELDSSTGYAVASRRPGGAEAIGERFGVPRRFSSYEQLCAEPAVDAVYVATPHPFHLANALLAIEAGKHVLVEKPFTMTGDEARKLVAAARSAGVFCMEAMWTRFLPHMATLRELLADGALGTIRTLHADHGQWFPADPSHRLFAPGLGGGALLDLGVYPVSFASMVLGPPETVQAVASPAMTGVDLTTSALLTYPSGAHAVLTCTSGARTPTVAWVAGDRGRVQIERTWYAGSTLTFTPRDGEVQRFEVGDVVLPGAGGLAAKGMRFEAAEAARCIAAGLPESPLMPLDETVSIMDTLDRIGRACGTTGG